MTGQRPLTTKSAGERAASRGGPPRTKGAPAAVGNQTMQRHLRGTDHAAQDSLVALAGNETSGQRAELAPREGPAEQRAQRAAEGKPGGPSGATAGIAQTASSSLFQDGGALLAPADRAYFEPWLGANLSSVRLHVDAEAGRSARALGARAFAVGSHIAFADNAPRPGTDDAKPLLAHELAHTLEPDSERTIRRQPADSPAPQASPGVDPAAAQPSPSADPAATRSQSGGNPASPQAAGPPVYWGFDISKQPRTYYVSIPPPGRGLEEVATFLYGSASAAADLRGANPGLSDMIPGGTVLHLPPGTLSSAAQTSLTQSLESGLVMRTTGVPESQAAGPDVMMHHLAIGGQSYDLLDDQFEGLLQGISWHLSVKADYYKGMCEVYRDTRNDHVENNSSLIRGVSDWMGDVSVPDESVYTQPMDRAQAIMDELASGQPTIDSVIKASQELRGVAEDYYAGERAWSIYINGTIHGAEVTASRLETVRNTCFAVEAGLAGAVVAPLAFAAAGTGLAAVGVTGTAATVLAGGTAIGAGTLAGGVLRGGLDVALPGLQADQPASERFVGGFKSGAMAGALGAAGALAAPTVAGAIAPRLGIAADVAPTAVQKVALGVSTGAVIGAPSGAVYSAVDKFADWRAGRISISDYFAAVGEGAALGALWGGVFGLIPIKAPARGGSALAPSEPVPAGANAGGAGAAESVGLRLVSFDPQSGEMVVRAHDPVSGEYATGRMNVKTGSGHIIGPQGKVTPIENFQLARPRPALPAPGEAAPEAPGAEPLAPQSPNSGMPVLPPGPEPASPVQTTAPALPGAQPQPALPAPAGRPPPRYVIAPENVLDPESRRLLPDFDQRISRTGQIEQIRAQRTSEGGLVVRISGPVRPGLLARTPARVGPGMQMAPNFNQMVRSRLGRLPQGLQWLHLWGPGLGDEAAAGMFVGPRSVNLFWQNGDIAWSGGTRTFKGIEGFVRELASMARAQGATLHLDATADAWPGGDLPMLKSASYEFRIIDQNGVPTRSVTVELELPDPSAWTDPSNVTPIVSISGVSL